ncbi:hypothetical protein [Xanthomonas sp. 3498]|uniref:hypothetical protein n=1 Tax=Xanthomonas sp. 3498 TaxID=2663863 RepID=UPI001618B3F9|nr:hypothetical protein [Xanthomonas sp. 3498]MBB5875845.1 hypothetical protein [Xanthomonas sp. 3498]
MADTEQRARELLAAEWDRLGAAAPARQLRGGCHAPPLIAAALNAISAALASQAKVQEDVQRYADRYRFIEMLAAGEPEDFAVVEDAAFATHRGCEHNFGLNIDAAMLAAASAPEGGSHG